MKTLIIYKSKHGTGKEVAAYLQQKLCADLQEADPALSWEGYERIVCVGSIYAGRLAKQLLACIRANTKELAGKSVGMLLCGMRKIIRMVNKQEHLYEDKDAVLVDRLRWDTIDSVIAGQTHEA